MYVIRLRLLGIASRKKRYSENSWWHQKSYECLDENCTEIKRVSGYFPVTTVIFYYVNKNYIRIKYPDSIEIFRKFRKHDSWKYCMIAKIFRNLSLILLKYCKVYYRLFMVLFMVWLFFLLQKNIDY